MDELALLIILPWSMFFQEKALQSYWERRANHLTAAAFAACNWQKFTRRLP